MSIEGTGALVRLAIVLAALTGLAALVTRLAGLGYSRAQVTAAGRAAVQLTIVGSLISAVLGSWWLTAGFALLMLVVAPILAVTVLSVQRIDADQRAVVGEPIWSPTTLSASFSRARRKMVLTKLPPRAPNTQLVRNMTDLQPVARTASSPASLLRP